MVSRCAFVFGSLVLASAALSIAALAPQDKGGKDKAAPAMSADDAAMMEKWNAFKTPGPEHKVLDAKVGKWNYVGRMWMEPGAPAMESPGTSEVKWIFGGRFLQDQTKGTWMGEPFDGLGLIGYDNLKKKYTGVWLDSGGTGVASFEGTYDAAKKEFRYTSQMPDVMQGKYVSSRTVETVSGPDTWKMEMFGPDKTGKEFKMMELVYTRAK